MVSALSHIQDFTSIGSVGTDPDTGSKTKMDPILISLAVPINVDFFKSLLFYMQVISSRTMVLPRQKIDMY